MGIYLSAQMLLNEFERLACYTSLKLEEPKSLTLLPSTSALITNLTIYSPTVCSTCSSHFRNISISISPSPLRFLPVQPGNTTQTLIRPYFNNVKLGSLEISHRTSFCSSHHHRCDQSFIQPNLHS